MTDPLFFCPQIKNKPCIPSSICVFLNSAQSRTCINFYILNFVFVVLMPELGTEVILTINVWLIIKVLEVIFFTSNSHNGAFQGIF
jgi:hypothetical protein